MNYLTQMYNGLNQTLDKPFVNEKAENVRVLKPGTIYLVPCLIRELRIKGGVSDDQEVWMDLDHEAPATYTKVIEYVPVWNHPHNDKENGQNEVHYHKDSRWAVNHQQTALPYNFEKMYDGRPRMENYDKLVYLPLVADRADEMTSTPVILIKNSKLKHKCIHKNKCPHRGFDLSNTPALDGVIMCPLHGLKFHSITGKLINEEERNTPLSLAKLIVDAMKDVVKIPKSDRDDNRDYY